MSKNRGFTLIELMLTIAVLAILIAWAIPSFSKLIEKRRLIGVAEVIREQLVNARTEAIKRSKPVVADFRIGADGTTWGIGLTDKDECNALHSLADAKPCTLDYDNDGGSVVARDLRHMLNTEPDGPISAASASVISDFSVTLDFDGGNWGECNAAGSGATCFDPVRGMAREGSVEVRSENYTLVIEVTPLGIIQICSDSGSSKFVTGYECGAGA